MKCYLLPFLFLGAICHALEFLAGGYLASGIPEVETITADSPYYEVRQSYALHVSPDANGNLELQLTNTQVGKYSPGTVFTLYSPDNKVIRSANIPLKESYTLKLEQLPMGIYLLKINSGQNACIVRAAAGYCCIEASQNVPFQPSYHCSKSYFIVQSGMLKIQCKGEPTQEHVALTVWDNSGNVVFTGNSLDKPQNAFDISIPIPAEQEGSVWSLKMDRVPGVGFEDMSLALIEGAEPFLALSPKRIALPIVRIFTAPTGQDGQVISGYHISPIVKNVPSLTIDFSFTSADESKPFTSKSQWKTGEENFILGVESKSADLLCGIASVQIRHEGKLLRDSSEDFAVCEGILFTEVPWIENVPPAVITPLDEKRGYQLFQRDEPGFVRPNTRPTQQEIRSVIKAETSPGLISAEFFALLPLRDFPDAAVTIGDLHGPNDAVIPASDIKMLAARIWRQRVDWNSNTYINAPELLEPKASLKFKAMVPQQYCVHVSVPSDAQPGVYKGEIQINCEPCIPYELTVDDFILPEYNDMTFGLYADGERWYSNPYTDEEYVAELRMFRAYGMNALMVYPFTGSKLSFNNGQWDINFDVFRHHMKLYAQEGFDGVLCVSLQHMQGVLINTLKRDKPDYTQEDYEAGFVAVMDAIQRMAKEDNWPKYCLHTIDEPHTPAQAVEAAKTLGFVKAHGGMTFNTCYRDIVNAYLRNCLDYRCFNNIAYFAFGSEEVTAELRKETLDDGAMFWWYGSGCYTNGGLQQDCNIYSTRHMLGLFNWRSKATGAWTWTFLRAKGDVANDFDGNRAGEAKEACICYPMPEGNGLIDTLQWEGCREGVYDYRYLRLWESLVEKAASIPEKATIAAESRAKVDAKVSSIKWTCLQFGVSNGELRDLRALLIDEIKRLK